MRVLKKRKIATKIVLDTKWKEGYKKRQTVEDAKTKVFKPSITHAWGYADI